MRFFLYPVDFFDSPEVLDCAITPIPGSASPPLQVVASLHGDFQEIRTTESTGQYIGVYAGAVGQEVLKCIIGGVDPFVQMHLRAGTRISLRNMDVAPITLGAVMCQFMDRTTHL